MREPIKKNVFLKRGCVTTFDKAYVTVLTNSCCHLLDVLSAGLFICLSIFLKLGVLKVKASKKYMILEGKTRKISKFDA